MKEWTMHYFDRDHAEAERKSFIAHGWACGEIFYQHGMFHFTAQKVPLNDV